MEAKGLKVNISKVKVIVSVNNYVDAERTRKTAMCCLCSVEGVVDIP